MTDDTIRQCWAYSKSGQRCEHPAGHPGNHVIMAEWGDDECATPQPPATAPPPPLPAPLTQTTSKCVACGHAHSGECKCGCHEFIG